MGGNQVRRAQGPRHPLVAKLLFGTALSRNSVSRPQPFGDRNRSFGGVRSQTEFGNARILPLPALRAGEEGRPCWRCGLLLSGDPPPLYLDRALRPAYDDFLSRPPD